MTPPLWLGWDGASLGDGVQFAGFQATRSLTAYSSPTGPLWPSSAPVPR
jgi:hypothetical protein